jgi:hypothetical protein
LPQIGADIARKGDDWSCHHVRWGPVSLHHESHNGWETTQNARRLMQLADEYAAKANAARERNARPIEPTEIPILVDDDGVGGGVVDLLRAGGYNVVPVNASSSPRRPDDYPNRRSELWFTAADRARKGDLDLSRLPRDVRARLKVQAMAPTWKLDAQGRRVVEPKDETKKKIGRSPDEMDALNLAFSDYAILPPPAVPKPERQTLEDRFRCRDSAARRHGLFGR